MAKVLSLINGQVSEIEINDNAVAPVIRNYGSGAYGRGTYSVAVEDFDSGAPVTLQNFKTFSISANTQVLFTEPIDMEMGSEIVFEVNSVLVEVN